MTKDSPFHDLLVTVGIYRRERVGGRQNDQIVDRFKRYLHASLFEELVKDYPPVEGFIITLTPTLVQDDPRWPS